MCTLFKPKREWTHQDPPGELQVSQLSIYKWGMDKKTVTHIHNGILLPIKKNAFESVLKRWMKLESIIQSEVSQKEKYQYSLLMQKYGI